MKKLIPYVIAFIGLSLGVALAVNSYPPYPGPRNSSAVFLVDSGSAVYPPLPSPRNSSPVFLVDPATGLPTAPTLQPYFNGCPQSGVTPCGNGADLTEDTLGASGATPFTFTIPANTLLNVGDTITIRIGGTFIGSTDNKTAKVRFGSIAFSTSTTTATITKWAAQIFVTKTGPSTQSYMAIWNLPSAAAAGTTTGITAQTDTAGIVVNATGQNITNSVANSIAGQYMSIRVN